MHYATQILCEHHIPQFLELNTTAVPLIGELSLEECVWLFDYQRWFLSVPCVSLERHCLKPLSAACVALNAALTAVDILPAVNFEEIRDSTKSNDVLSGTTWFTLFKTPSVDSFELRIQWYHTLGRNCIDYCARWPTWPMPNKVCGVSTPFRKCMILTLNHDSQSHVTIANQILHAGHAWQKKQQYWQVTTLIATWMLQWHTAGVPEW